MAYATTAHAIQTHYHIPSPFQPQYHPSNLSDFQDPNRLQELWRTRPGNGKQPVVPLKEMYDAELLSLCATGDSPLVGWEEFMRYAEAKEHELWHIFHDLDLDGSGRLDPHELLLALGIEYSPIHLSQFKAHFTASSLPDSITYNEFRDILLFLPRKPSPPEIYRYYKFRYRIGVNEGSAPVNSQVGVSPGQPKTISGLRYSSHPQAAFTQDKAGVEAVDNVPEEEEAKRHKILVPNTSPKFLLAGGIAGVVSRTCTAPFDRLKVFLITRPPELGGCVVPAKPSLFNIVMIKNAVARIYAEGGILAFWTGNGLSVAKVFPESAIKFFAYESSKRAFARYWDDVDDPRDISGTSRFLSGGIGGISSQLAIYPVETLKTQMMSDMGKRRHLAEAVRQLWLLGGLRAYYRGLTVGLIGVFPYSAIDMSTFEALKLAYVRSTGKEKPGVLTLLAFGSISGSVGAISVYPLNLVRTRLQASGSPGHPQRYTGVWDVAIKTWERDGWRGFYRGLFPTLGKVIPSVSLSYVVYEYSKRRLGV